MDLNKFSNFWQQYFPKCLPVSSLFRCDLTDRWFRFHSLPESKRYAENGNEVAELLVRQNTVLLDVIGEDRECILVFGNYSSSPSLEDECPGASNFELQEFIKLSKQEFDPEELEADEEPIYLSLYCGKYKLKRNSLDEVLLCVAEEQIVNFFVMSYERQRIFAPYDGGVDVILKDAKEREEFKEKYKDWLSIHPKGL